MHSQLKPIQENVGKGSILVCSASSNFPISFRFPRTLHVWEEEDSSAQFIFNATKGLSLHFKSWESFNWETKY